MRILNAAAIVLSFLCLNAHADAPQAYAGKPYHDQPVAIPTKVKATEYDIAWQVVDEMSIKGAELLKPIFDAHKGSGFTGSGFTGSRFRARFGRRGTSRNPERGGTLNP